MLRINNVTLILFVDCGQSHDPTQDFNSLQIGTTDKFML